MPATNDKKLSWPAEVPPIPLIHTGPRSGYLSRTIELLGIEIPAGYETDGASVPRLFYNILGRFTIALPAALVHDCRYDPPPNDRGVKYRWLTRKQADQEFYENLRKCGVNIARAQAAYRAVRLFGWKPWNAGTKRGIKNI